MKNIRICKICYIYLSSFTNAPLSVTTNGYLKTDDKVKGTSLPTSQDFVKRDQIPGKESTTKWKKKPSLVAALIK